MNLAFFVRIANLIYNAGMKKLHINILGRKVAVNHVGQGKPVFMLHGWGGGKESWDALINELSSLGLLETFCFIAIDFPGFGESEEPVEAWGVMDYSKWFGMLVDTVYETLKLQGNYDLIVHSFGGRVLLKYLSYFEERPANPDKLVMIAAAGIKPVKTTKVKMAAIAAKTGKKVMSLPVLRWTAPAAQKLLYKLLKSHDYEKTSGVMRETFIKVIDEDLTSNIREVNRPTLILWGDQDSYVPVEDGKFMEQNIKGSSMKVIKGGRHGIHKTHAKELAVWIKDFLTGL
ncbi:alpha/beta hydrolase [Candidatus Peregrinibacteria bacterium]|nr:alpha/beta hydrolase [Candidatus Peregrinibacteria bacterium]